MTDVITCANHKESLAVWIEPDGTGRCGECRPRTVLIPGHFDNKPINAITAADVRNMRANISHKLEVAEQAALYEIVMHGLLGHPGVSSSARAVVEAAIECAIAS